MNRFFLLGPASTRPGPTVTRCRLEARRADHRRSAANRSGTESAFFITRRTAAVAAIGDASVTCRFATKIDGARFPPMVNVLILGGVAKR
jgi:hypothetical protein